ncbi:MAG: Na+/H+ antiporter NhaA [Gammaproteobacteria bacterium]|nr:Na+/H+ antiporter NhaA [Gammaproteobacteria bacterium]
MSTQISDQNMFQRFLHSQVTGSLILIVATIIALIWANSQWGDYYYELSHTYVGIHFDDWKFSLSLSHWIKDGLMAIFFFVVGLEIKREIAVGELSTLDRAMLPVCAAIGGAIVPATIYALVNSSGEAAAGWGIPMATDIAFALGVLSMFGSRVPLGLKVFLTALAIADDLFAVAVIAVFYTPDLDIGFLLFAFLPLGLMLFLNHIGVRVTWVYSVLAIVVWLDVLGSGVHATIAGVLVAMVIPVRPAIDPIQFTEKTSHLLASITGQDNSLDALIHDAARREKLEQLSLAVEDATPPAIALEHSLHPLQSFVILPLFALFSAGVAFSPENLAGFPSGVELGVILGLVVGKPLGVLLASWLVIKLAKVDLFDVTLPQLVGAGCLGGIGFTMSIFISELAFTTDAMIDQAKLGILVASVTAGVLGAIVLHFALPPKKE